ncbi:MAG TPA: hypothetical protein VJ932_01990, partial [Alkalispirochaeta sp.]|nr:hypothetical protein [Alkalispirochaeta sp.]
EHEWVSLKMLTAAGLNATYSPAQLTARVSIPSALQPVREINGSGISRRHAGDTVSPARVSAAVPVELSAQHMAVGESESTPGQTRQRVGVAFLPSVTYAGTVLSGQIDAQHGDDQPAIESWQAAISRDIFGTTRLTAGTTRIDSHGFQTGQPIFGAGIEKRAGLAGTPVLADRFQAFFELETAGTAEVYLNNRLIRSERLPPGRYALSDVPLVPGLNNVRIVITDELGTTREIVDRVAHASALLSPGTVEYGLAVGTQMEDFDRAVGRAYYRRGIVPGATGAIYAEATVDDQLLGTLLTSSLPIGIISVGGAAGYAAGDNQSPAYEYAVEGGYRFSAPSARWIPSFGLSLVHRSAGFSAPGTLQEARPTRVAPLVAGASVSQPLPFGISLVVGGRYTIGATDDTDRASAFAYLGAQIGRGVSLRTAFNGDNLTEDPQFRGRISVAVGIGNGRYRSTASVPEPTIDLSTTQNFSARQTRGSAGLALNRIDSGAGTVESASGNARITHPRGEAAGAFRIAPGETVLNDRVERTEARVRLGAGLYYADGVVGVGRPTSGSFAVIGSDATLPADTVLVNPRGAYAEARSGILGGAVLTSVPDYYRKPIRIEVPGLPIDYALQWTDVVYESGYRSGVGLRVGGGQLLYGSGTLLDEAGEAVALRVIRVTAGDETMYTGFTDENGTFLVYDLMPGEYMVRFGDTGPAAAFSLPADAAPPVELGTLKLRPTAGGNS